VEPTTPLNEIATNRNVAPAAAAAASGRLNSVNTFLTSNDLKNFVPGAQINPQFPIYSYKRYTPLPTVVYTQHEEETNDLIAGLKAGYASPPFKMNTYILTIFPDKKCLLLSL
jgi:hypothetical protein